MLTDQVTLTEDLTLPRRKLLKTVRELDVVEFAFVKDGAILAKQRRGPFVKVESADDLFHLGVTTQDYEQYYNLK